MASPGSSYAWCLICNDDHHFDKILIGRNFNPLRTSLLIELRQPILCSQTISGCDFARISIPHQFPIGRELHVAVGFQSSLLYKGWSRSKGLKANFRHSSPGSSREDSRPNQNNTKLLIENIHRTGAHSSLWLKRWSTPTTQPDVLTRCDFSNKQDGPLHLVL